MNRGADGVATLFVFWQIRYVRNVTVSMDDDLVRWVRREAARRDISISRFLADLAKAQMRSERRYRRALGSALARDCFLKGDGRYLARDEIR
jgi:hypothetical protein